VEIMRAVMTKVKHSSNIVVAENAFTIDLLTDENGCCGAIVFIGGQIQLIWAKQTILATGGAGQLYRETTNPPVATADGHAIAIRAGVTVRDMEFMQFHPTLLYIAGGSRSLISEAVRGEGAYLLDREGHRFMPDYDNRAELAPRDIVSQSIVTQMEKTQHPNVYLSLRHLPPDKIHERFPGISQTCQQYGLDIARDAIPVRPGAHYMIGGVIVDLTGRTSMPNLWAAGEVTSSGLHGANRLASNSLLEGAVYGDLAGTLASQAVLAQKSTYLRLPLLDFNSPAVTNRELDLYDIRNSLKSLMWRAAGVKRSFAELSLAAETTQAWLRLLSSQTCDSVAGWELQNMLLVSALMIDAAKTREESRGVHFREDFPQPAEHWRRSIIYVGTQRSLSDLRTEQTLLPQT
jgi:L-aspartate oxidase